MSHNRLIELAMKTAQRTRAMSGPAVRLSVPQPNKHLIDGTSFRAINWQFVTGALLECNSSVHVPSEVDDLTDGPDISEPGKGYCVTYDNGHVAYYKHRNSAQDCVEMQERNQSVPKVKYLDIPVGTPYFDEITPNTPGK